MTQRRYAFGPTDPEIAKLLEAELNRQRSGLELIASENFASPAVIETMGTVLTNKYSEGMPGKRYYGGNEFIDQVENLARDRAKQLFKAGHANVQSHAGATANAAAYLALIKPGDTVLAMDLAAGGHLTHGHKLNFSGQLYRFVGYGVSKDTERIDMDEVRRLAQEHQPKLIVAGASAYPRIIDFAAFREIASEVGAKFMVDMAHIAGLVATGIHPSPVPHADVITTTTHKTLRGPRGAMILCTTELAEAIDKAVMPGIQGGPLDHVIAAKAVAFQEALLPEFTVYQQNVVTNAATLAETLAANGIRVISGGTDNHLVLLDVTSVGTTGKVAEKALDAVGIYTNKNVIPFDQRKPLDPSGIRVGSPALTTRGFTREEIVVVANLISDILKQPADAAVADRVRQQVAALTASHPLYPGLSYLA